MEKINFWQRTWIPFVTQRPRLTISAMLLLTLAISWGIGGVGLSASPREYMGQDSPRTLELVRLENTYSRTNAVMVMFSVTSGSIFNPQSLEAIRQFTEAAWSLPFVERVDSLTNFQHSYAIDDEIIVEDLVDGDATLLSNEQITQIESIALTEPRLRGFLVAEDGRATAVNITFHVELHDNLALKQIEREVDKLVAETLSRQPDFSVHETGYIEVCLGWLNAMTFDATYMFSSAIVLIFVTLLVFFRSLSIATITLLLAIFSITASLGVVGYFKAMIHPPSMIGTLVILMLALADAIHVVNRTRRLLAQGQEKTAAISESLRFNLKPVFITSLTTSIGFITFLANDFSGIRLMGAYIAFGVMYACLLSITVLPATLVLLKVKPGSVTSKALQSSTLVNTVLKWRWGFVVLTVPLIVACAYIIAHTPLDDSPIHYIAESQPFRQDQKIIEQRLTGSIEVVMELHSGQAQGITDPAFMTEVDRFVQWLRSQNGVRAVNAYTDTVKHLNRILHRDHPEAYALPESQALAAQYLLLYELSLPYGLPLTNQLSIDKSATRLSFIIDDTTTVYMMKLSDNVDQWLRQYAPHVSANRISGDTVEFSISNFHSLNSMFYGAMVALAVIGIILLITFRKLMPGLLCTIMVVSPLSVCFGIWSLMQGYFDVGAVLTMCMVIGVVVDNAVHFVSKYQMAVTEMGLSPHDAIHYVTGNVGIALITNTLVLAAGFSILSFSAFTANSEMGILTVMSLLIGLAGTFTLLPSLLVIWSNWQNRSAVQ